ncbi:hypothetical protein [Listeria monocytogenes]|uniref:hypothetical protein n=1 Tax=Listeria monocytogenes TaxID=1639 RepID=UPI001E4565E5|nr:hypothetical protein [Listeria monocytogenes]MCD2228571.1 hypothetical protein [Listeria monocytogenes]
MIITRSEEYKDYILESTTSNKVGIEQTTYKFDNGYGASVIEEYNPNTVELAVTRFTHGNYWEIDYGTSIADNILTNLTQDELNAALQAIKALPSKEETK